MPSDVLFNNSMADLSPDMKKLMKDISFQMRPDRDKIKWMLVTVRMSNSALYVTKDSFQRRVLLCLVLSRERGNGSL